MGLDALTRRNDGTDSFPANAAAWREWVSASTTRSYVLGDPLLDWLDVYGKLKGFPRDTDLPGYDPRTDFTELLFEQGRRFEQGIVALLAERHEVARLSSTPEDIRSLVKAEDTFKAMEGGTPIIHQGVLWDAEHRTYGAPDLLIRSDVLASLFPDSLSRSEAAVAAPHLLHARWHYRIVDIKFTTLGFNAAWELGNKESSPAYKVQVFIYNRALGRLQGFEPPVAYVLGRSWKKGSGNTLQRGSSAFERLAPVPQGGTVTHGRPIVDLAEESVAWVRRLRSEGEGWDLLPFPPVPELYPNMGNDEDAPFHQAKKTIADEIQELTLLWWVGPPGRAKAHASGVTRWRAPACTPSVVGVNGPKQASVLQAILDVNRSQGAPVLPARIQGSQGDWRKPTPVEFFVDFETVSDLYDDFSKLPVRGGQPLIFMIGCGHLERGKWQFECFVVDRLTEPDEARIVDAWLSHMEDVRRRLGAEGDEPPRVIHWSPAETGTFETAYNAAKERHPGNTWPAQNWFDFLNRVVKAEPVVVRGALNFGLKAIAKALRGHRLIETTWEDGPADGLGAMVAAWRCEEEAQQKGCRLIDLELMQGVRAYNEVDCKAMSEVVAYLRRSH